MRDINFFSPYIKDDSSLQKRKNIFVAVIIIIIFVSGIATAFIFHKKNSLINEKLKYEAYLNSKEVKEKIRIAQDEKRKIEVMRKYNAIVGVINSKMSTADNVNNVLLSELSSCLPQDVFMKKMDIKGLNISISGAALKRTSVGEFAYNLKELSIFEDVHVGNISQENNALKSCAFTVNCKIKGGGN